ncbi:hypothetical protein CS542_10185 [Pedobacter sp. IW39]|nr:hypothetical protein CS542_10185 [Pedobacter sp. IW39]
MVELCLFMVVYCYLWNAKANSIDTENLQATVEPGVITEEFMNAVAERGLLYPVDPSSKGSCFIECSPWL